MKLNEVIVQEQTEEEIEAELKRLEPIADKFEFAQSEARDITKAIKYENTTMEIMIGLGGLADKLGIDERELDYYESRVREAKNQLESAIYEMEELFADKYSDVRNKIDELEMDLEDLEYERNR